MVGFPPPRCLYWYWVGQENGSLWPQLLSLLHWSIRTSCQVLVTVHSITVLLEQSNPSLEFFYVGYA